MLNSFGQPALDHKTWGEQPVRKIAEIDPLRMWIGNVEDVRDIRAAVEAGVVALVDVAGVDPAITLLPTLIYCRFPLIDEPGNPTWLLRAAISTTAQLLGEQRPTMVACGQGMSRSVVIAAGALAVVRGLSPDSCLADVKRNASSMVSAGLWQEVKAALTGSDWQGEILTWGEKPPDDFRLANLPALVRDFRAGRPVAGWRRNEVWANPWLDLPVRPLGYYRVFSVDGSGTIGARSLVLGQDGEVFVSGKHPRHWLKVDGIH